MRKNVNKLVAFAIGISVISGGAIPAFAADTTTSNNNTVVSTNTSANNSTVQSTSGSTTNTTTSIQSQNNNASIGTSAQVQTKPLLKLKDAIKAAISTSDKVSLQDKKIKLEEEKLDIQDELDGSGNEYDIQKLEVKQEKENKEFLEDQIEQDITNEYNDIVAKEKDLNYIKRQIEIKTKEIKDSELKKKLGLITSIDMKTAQVDLETLKNSQKDKENKLKNSKDYFLVLTGKDLNKYSLEQDPTFEVFKIEGSVDDYFDDVIDKYLRFKTEKLKITREEVRDNKVDKPDSDDDAPRKSSYTQVGEDGKAVFDGAGYASALQEYQNRWKTYGAYLEQKYAVSQGQVGLEESKKSLKKGLKESYASLLDLENNINVMKSNVEINNKQLSVLKLKLDMGLVTKTEYNKQVLASEDLETKLRTLVDNYNKLKNGIKKPWITGGLLQ